MSAVEISNVSNTSQEPTPVLRSTSQYPPQYLDCVKLIIKRKVCDILNGFWEILFSLVFIDVGYSQYVSLSPQNLVFIQNGLLSLNFALSRWYHDALCQIFYPVLTHWVVNFEISSTVPFCCVAIQYNVILFL